MLDDFDPEYERWKFSQQRQGETEYAWGYRLGYDDAYLDAMDLRSRSPQFRDGFRNGKADIEAICEEVTESRYFQ